MKRKTFAAAFLIAASLAATAYACLWDSDTLQMERMRFPGVLEIITGRFVRHSKAYYEWRTEDRLKKLETDPDNPALIDDLAVGYDKLGRYDEGIAVLEKSLAAHPDRYETLANLATLLFHAGRLEESKQYVERALKINPDAHFGREKYQLLLTDYVLQSKLKEEGVLSTESRYWEDSPHGFAEFVLRAEFPEADDRSHVDPSGNLVQSRVDELKKAGNGVLGMMHFADHESPVLLEVLGDILMTGQMEQNGTQLAARAYLRAAQLSKEPKAREHFEKMARMAIANHIDFENLQEHEVLPALEERLAPELKAGKEFFAAIERQEQEWIDDGRDVDREFAAVYYSSLDQTIAEAEKKLQQEPRDRRLSRREQVSLAIAGAAAIIIGVPVAVVCLSGIAVFFWLRKRNARHQALTKQTIS